MDREERLSWCRQCTNRETRYDTGVVCGLTGTPPFFSGTCPHFELDLTLVNKEEKKKVEDERGTRKSRRLVIAMGAAVILAIITAIVFSAVETYSAERHAELPLKEFGYAVEDSLWQANGQFFNDHFDTDGLASRTAGNRATRSTDLPLLKRRISSLYPGEYWVGALRRGGDVRFVSSYFDDYPHAIFEIYDPGFGLNFVDLECRVDDDGAILIKDVFDYSVGLHYSEWGRIYGKDCRVVHWDITPPRSGSKFRKATDAIYNARRLVDMENYMAALSDLRYQYRGLGDIPRKFVFKAALARHESPQVAADYIATILDVGPTNDRFRTFYEFKLAVFEGRTDRAIVLSKALQEYTGLTDMVPYYIALSYIHEEKYDQALTYLDKVIERVPNLRDAYYNRTCCLIEEGKMSEAVTYIITICTEIDPGNTNAILTKLAQNYPAVYQEPAFIDWQFSEVEIPSDSTATDTLLNAF